MSYGQIEASPYIPLAGMIRDGLAVYCATYDAIAAVEPNADQLLDENEANRARRFVYERDRDRFILAHAYLRRIAASHLGRSVEELRLSTQENKPPVVISEMGGTGLQLSLSHCASHVDVAVSDRSAVGVDVENLLPSAECKELAPLVCSQSEQAQLSQIAPDEYSLEFIRIWTAKEAVSKVVGLGMGSEFFKISRSCTECRSNIIEEYEYSNTYYKVHKIVISHDCVLAYAIDGEWRSGQ